MCSVRPFVIEVKRKQNHVLGAQGTCIRSAGADKSQVGAWLAQPGLVVLDAVVHQPVSPVSPVFREETGRSVRKSHDLFSLSIEAFTTCAMVN